MRSTNGSRVVEPRSGRQPGRVCRTACRGPRSCRSTPAWRERGIDVGGSVARPAPGTPLPGVRDPRHETSPCSRSGDCPDDPGADQGRGFGRPAPRRPRRPYRHDLRPGGAHAGRPPQPAVVRGADRHRPDSGGGRASPVDQTVLRPEVEPGGIPARARPSVPPISSVPPRRRRSPFWSSVGARHAVAAFEALGRFLTPVRTPIGDSWILGRDEPTFRTAPGPGGLGGSSRAATRTSSSGWAMAPCSFPTRTVEGGSGRLASGRSAAGRRRGGGHLAAHAGQGVHPAVAASLSSPARCRRGGGLEVPAPGARRADRRSLGTPDRGRRTAILRPRGTIIHAPDRPEEAAMPTIVPAMGMAHVRRTLRRGRGGAAQEATGPAMSRNERTCSSWTATG